MDSELIAVIAGAKKAAALVTVLEIKGSAPRHAGSKMLVRPGEALLGTVGGGRLEAAAIKTAEDCVRSGRSALIEVEMLGEEAVGSDMICGGSSRMLVELAADPGPYRAAQDLLGQGRRALLVKRISLGVGSPDCAISTAVLDEDLRAVHGSGEGLDERAARKALASGKPVLADEGKTFYDPILPEEKLVILGAGHVGRAIAMIAAGLDFSITVVDDRADMADPSRFPSGTKIVVSGYAEAIASLPFDSATYAVVVTRGHVYDLECVRALLRREYRYVGMIGSSRKTRLILEQAKADGFESAKVEALYAPIGLDIAAETPEEIAVCILGEIIAVRRNAKALPELAAKRAARRA
jgi:xanthine dehydrogenase accessory factor